MVYFVDQIENFARFVRQGDRDVKILRESICQTSPTSETSFVFQMHGRAMEAIEDWWMNEHLPSLDFSKKLNQPRIIDLKGLQSLDEAVKLVERYLLDKRVPNAKPPHLLHPFPEEVIEAVFKATKPRTPSDQSKRGKGNDCWDRDAIFGAGPCLELIPQTPERRWRQCTEDRKDHKGLKRNQAPV